MSVEISNKAPDFSVIADNNKKISLSDFAGQNLVLYFYPKDDTPGCTVEANDFKDAKEEFAKLNTQIIGVSRDNVAKHCKFIEKYSLNFNLLSDEDETLCKAYDVIKEKSMYGKKYLGIDRSTFLIDAEGTIRNIWRNVKVKNHVKEVLDAVHKLN